jgi:hypothetical protein
VTACTTKYAEKTVPAVVGDWSRYSTRNVGRNDAVACQTNAAATASTTVNAIRGRESSSATVPSSNRSRIGWSGRRGVVGRTRQANRTAAGTATAAPSATAGRQPYRTPIQAAATGATSPAAGPPALWKPMAAPMSWYVRVSSVVATL